MHDGRTPPAIMGAVTTAASSPLRRVAAGLIGIGALLTSACTSAVIEDTSAADAVVARASAPRPSTSTTAVEALTLEARTLPPLPVPEPLPLDEWAPTPEVVLGRVQIPAIGLDEDLHQGMTLTAINRGPSQWPGTALPGQVGNMVIAGHRTTYGRPFHDLDLVQPGDEMVVSTPDGVRHVYVASGTEVVGPDALWIAEQSYGSTATTFACHPKGSARERIVVRWQLVDATGAPVPPLA
jgi:sortase A